MGRCITRRGSGRLTSAAVASVVITLLVAGLVACGEDRTATSQAKPMKFKVMEFNIEYGGTQVSFKKVVEAIEAADPDVVGVEEAETNIPRLARALGWQYYSSGMMIVSKYPVFEPSGSDGVYAFVEVQPGRVVAIANVHLPSSPYGPYAIKIGKSAEEVIALEERVRLPAVEKQLQVLPGLAGSGIPVFITGDFNSPSALDYTQGTVGTRPQIKYPLAWPVSKALHDAGFRDSWRDVYPDPVEHQGLTWWAARPRVSGWNPGEKNPQDRIDFIYAAGPSKTVASQIVGEKGGPEVGIPISPWPSDHRALVSTFDVTPGTMPVLVAVDTWLLTAGDEIEVTFHAPGKDGEQVALVPIGGDPTTGATAREPTGAAGTTDGVLTFATSGLKQGGYEAVLIDADGAALARIPFWVQAKGARPGIATNKRSYAQGEPIVVTWQNAPANRWDWLGVYKAAAADPMVDYYLIWQYTGGATAGTLHGMPAGSLTLDETAEGSPWPLPPGTYEVFYLLADGYDWVARASFTVVE